MEEDKKIGEGVKFVREHVTDEDTEFERIRGEYDQEGERPYGSCAAGGR